MPWLTQRFAAAAALLALVAVPAAAQGDLVAALRGGGYVIVMRHAHAPFEPPVAGQAEADNATGERQLDPAGKAQAEAIGGRLKSDGIPVGPVYASPTFRALQTARLMGFARPQARAELGDGGASMAASASGQAGAAWLKAKAAEPPPPGKDALVITHGPNIALAFGDDFKGMGDGEAAVFHPDGRGGFTLAGRIKPDGWGP